jgi:hypothetical protein
MNTITLEREIVLVTHECISCGVIFGMTKQFDDRRKQDKASFYCPNGHPAAYVESEADRLRRSLENERRKLSTAQFELMMAEKKVKRLEKRTKNGVCPCCHRQFQSVARHMATKHPDFAEQSS